MAEQLDRFRSFVERYVIARAVHFEVGREQEQAWMAIQDAKKVYGMAADARNETDPAPMQAGTGNVQQAPSTPGPHGPQAYPWTSPNQPAKPRGVPVARNAAMAVTVSVPDNTPWLTRLIKRRANLKGPTI